MSVVREVGGCCSPSTPQKSHLWLKFSCRVDFAPMINLGHMVRNSHTPPMTFFC